MTHEIEGLSPYQVEKLVEALGVANFPTANKLWSEIARLWDRVEKLTEDRDAWRNAHAEAIAHGERWATELEAARTRIAQLETVLAETILTIVDGKAQKQGVSEAKLPDANDLSVSTTSVSVPSREQPPTPDTA